MLEQRIENLVYRALEGVGCTREAKGHYQELVHALVGAEGCFEHILIGQSYLMIPLEKVQLGEPFCA